MRFLVRHVDLFVETPTTVFELDPRQAAGSLPSCASCKFPLYRSNEEAMLAYGDSRFLLVLDEPEGVPGRFELGPACDVGGCQW